MNCFISVFYGGERDNCGRRPPRQMQTRDSVNRFRIALRFVVDVGSLEDIVRVLSTWIFILIMSSNDGDRLTAVPGITSMCIVWRLSLVDNAWDTHLR